MVASLALFGLAVGSLQAFETPKITSLFEEPKVAGGAGPNVTVDAATRQKLTDLAKLYGEVAVSTYPTIVHALRIEKEPQPKQVRILVTYGYEGVAATFGAGFGGRATGPIIRVSAKYALEHPDDVGMIVHEMVHVVQGYPKYDPVWLVEGVADWVRWFNWEKISNRPRPNPNRATARDSYQTTGAFLYWVSTHYDINFVPALHKLFQENEYRESFFKERTGKTLDELNTEWQAWLKSQAGARAPRTSSR